RGSRRRNGLQVEQRNRPGGLTRPQYPWHDQIGGAVHAFRILRNSTTKATDHELQKYDNFTRYGHQREADRSLAECLVRPAVRSWDLAQAARSPGCAAATVPQVTVPQVTVPPATDVVIEPEAEPAAAATATTEATATSGANKRAPTATPGAYKRATNATSGANKRATTATSAANKRAT